MSRMTKFLKQTCKFERAKRDSLGNVLLDRYGDVIYETAVTLKCRREQVIRDVQTSTGSILRSSTRYFTDNRNLIQADDRFDGKAVLEVEEYINSVGVVEGYESYV